MAKSHKTSSFVPAPIFDLSQSELAYLKRLLSLFGTSQEAITGSLPLGGNADEAERLHRKAQWIGAMRWQRHTVFPQAIFGEPAWDTLIQLYVSHGRQRMSLGSLAKATGVPQTTLLRWLNYLGDGGLVSSKQNPNDSRVRYLDLTGKGLAIMTSYLQSMPPMPN